VALAVSQRCGVSAVEWSLLDATIQMTAPLTPELQTGTSRRGYWIAAGLVVASLAIAALVFWRVYANVAAMPRIDAQGEHVVNLPAGELVVFVEPHGGTAAGSLRCAARDSAGTQLAIAAAGAMTSYDLGSYHGRSVFDLDVPASGPVTILCETDGDLTLAFGGGIGKTIAIGGALSALVGLSSIFVFGRTFLRRRRERRAPR
jgi:hypothetical protein